MAMLKKYAAVRPNSRVFPVRPQIASNLPPANVHFRRKVGLDQSRQPNTGSCPEHLLFAANQVHPVTFFVLTYSLTNLPVLTLAKRIEAERQRF